MAAFLACLAHVSAQTTITNTIPADGATGVSPTAAVEFDFSAPMNSSSPVASFYTLSPPGAYPVSSVWSSGNTVLMCTPTAPFTANASISWVVSGMDANGMQVFAQGSFTTGSGSGGPTGYGTNKISSFVLNKIYSYVQGPTGPPVPNASAPFIFNGFTILASNRTATSITLTLPNNAVSNLNQNIAAKEDYYLFYFGTSSNTFATTFPDGNYAVTVNATASNQTVSVSMPASMAQPNAPEVTNYTAAQAVDPSKPFTLGWKPFLGGTASNAIVVTVGNWSSPTNGAPGALDGTFTAVTIPPGTLQPNTNYTVVVGFQRGIFSTNTTYATGVFRVTLTTLTLQTIGGTNAPPPVVSNPTWSGNSFGFDVDTTPGQTVTVVYSTDCSLPLSQWQKLSTTNSPGPRVHFSDPSSATRPAIYYSVRNGP